MAFRSTGGSKPVRLPDRNSREDARPTLAQRRNPFLPARSASDRPRPSLFSSLDAAERRERSVSEGSKRQEATRGSRLHGDESLGHGERLEDGIRGVSGDGATREDDGVGIFVPDTPPRKRKSVVGSLGGSSAHNERTTGIGNGIASRYGNGWHGRPQSDQQASSDCRGSSADSSLSLGGLGKNKGKGKAPEFKERVASRVPPKIAGLSTYQFPLEDTDNESEDGRIGVESSAQGAGSGARRLSSDLSKMGLQPPIARHFDLLTPGDLSDSSTSSGGRKRKRNLDAPPNPTSVGGPSAPEVIDLTTPEKPREKLRAAGTSSRTREAVPASRVQTLREPSTRTRSLDSARQSSSSGSTTSRVARSKPSTNPAPRLNGSRASRLGTSTSMPDLPVSGESVGSGSYSGGLLEELHGFSETSKSRSRGSSESRRRQLPSTFTSSHTGISTMEERSRPTERGRRAVKGGVERPNAATRSSAMLPHTLGGQTVLLRSPSMPRAASNVTSDEALARMLQEAEYSALQSPSAAMVNYGEYDEEGAGINIALNFMRQAPLGIPKAWTTLQAMEGSQLRVDSVERLAPQGGRAMDAAEMERSERCGILGGNVASNPGNYMDDDEMDMSYESLLALSERIGDAKPKGLPQNVIRSLPVQKYKAGSMSGDEAKYEHWWIECVLAVSSG
ncbi:hypothetical protein HK104_011014 [Borealophlyctis nickersoniae]|nr:hypothetical protein HK104_011014 [Borealophlyctis nickersoniae]